MRRLSVIFCMAFASVACAATPAAAQINARTLTLAGVSDCIAEALANNAVDDDGVAIIFSCTAGKARTLYNFLGKKIRAEIVQDRNGKFENRAFGNSACYHRIEDQNGSSVDEFRCDLIMAIGDALAE
jgi:Na+/H+-dicarboxylate symporter